MLVKQKTKNNTKKANELAKPPFKSMEELEKEWRKKVFD